MRVLITGAAGFVGRHLYQAHLAAGDNVLGIDPLLPAFLGHNSPGCVRFFADEQDVVWDVVYHCAAFVNGREGIDGSPAYLHTYNTMLDAAMFTWALKARPGRIVYFSSSAAYPKMFQFRTSQSVPLLEGEIDLDEPLEPETTYGFSKLHGEQMARDVRSAGVPVTVLRPFSGYGPDQDPRYPFRAFLERARRRDDPFEIWGDGTQVRDWVHISDLVGAAIAAVEQGVDGPVNVCTGVGTSFYRLASFMADQAGYVPNITYRMDKPVGVQYRVGNPTLLQEFYTPKISIEEGVRMALAEA